MKSSTKLTIAFILVWNMSQNNCCAVDLFKIVKLLSEPAKHVTRVLELNHALPVEVVANVSIQSDNLGERLSKLLTFEVGQRNGIVAPVLKQFYLLRVFDEIIPRRRPLVNCSVLFGNAHAYDILRVCVMVSNCRVHLEASKSCEDICGDVLHNLDIVLESKGVNIVRNGVSSPKNCIRLNFGLNELHHRVKSRLV